jgi:hypothetical protein
MMVEIKYIMALLIPQRVVEEQAQLDKIHKVMVKQEQVVLVLQFQ